MRDSFAGEINIWVEFMTMVGGIIDDYFELSYMFEYKGYNQ